MVYTMEWDCMVKEHLYTGTVVQSAALGLVQVFVRLVLRRIQSGIY